MTAIDQLHAQMAYVKLLDVLRDVEQIKDKDCMLINVQLTLCRLEDVLQNYIGPLKKE
jgi:hypothetical protein